jgi:transposase
VHLAQQVHTMASQDARAKASRRRYSEAFKRELVERSLQPGASVSAIALEHRMNANVLFKWRRAHLRGAARIAQRVPGAAVLLPVNVSAAQQSPAHTSPAHTASTTALRAGVIEIDLGGARVRVHGAVDEANLRCVLQALRTYA